jgi:hypothetical protein
LVSALKKCQQELLALGRRRRRAASTLEPGSALAVQLLFWCARCHISFGVNAAPSVPLRLIEVCDYASSLRVLQQRCRTLKGLFVSAARQKVMHTGEFLALSNSANITFVAKE